MYLWIDPPGDDPGWIYDLASADDIPAALARHEIPDDNTDRIKAHDEQHEGSTPERYQAAREFWGVTVLGEQLPGQLPDEIKMVTL